MALVGPVGTVYLATLLHTLSVLLLVDFSWCINTLPVSCTVHLSKRNFDLAVNAISCNILHDTPAPSLFLFSIAWTGGVV